MKEEFDSAENIRRSFEPLITALETASEDHKERLRQMLAEKFRSEKTNGLLVKKPDLSGFKTLEHSAAELSEDELSSAAGGVYINMPDESETI